MKPYKTPFHKDSHLKIALLSLPCFCGWSEPLNSKPKKMSSEIGMRLPGLAELDDVDPFHCPAEDVTLHPVIHITFTACKDLVL